MDIQILAAIGAITVTYLYCRAFLWFGREWEAMEKEIKE